MNVTDPRPSYSPSHSSSGAGSPPPLAHERLDAWHVALALDAEVVAVARAAGRGLGWVTDQATRATGSVVLNLAESMGRAGADRARILRIAHGSALEADAALTLLAIRGACAAMVQNRCRVLTARLVAMIVGLIRRAEAVAHE